MQTTGNTVYRIRTGWASRLARCTAAILLFQMISGLAVTFGPFHPVVGWGLVLHTAIGVLTVAPMVWYFVRHWVDYSRQSLSDVLILGYVGLAALALCNISGLAITWQGLLATRTTPLLRYFHLVMTLAALTASIPHIAISWLHRRGAEFTRPAGGFFAQAALGCAVGVIIVMGLARAYAGARYRNEFPPDYSFAFGRSRPFAPSLARTSTNRAFDARSLAGSATCGSSG